MIEEEVSRADKAGFGDFEIRRLVRAGLERLPGPSSVPSYNKGSLEPAKSGKGGKMTHGRIDFPASVDY